MATSNLTMILIATKHFEQTLLSCLVSGSFDYLLWLRLKGGRQHVGEEFQSYRKQELHEGDNNEHQEG